MADSTGEPLGLVKPSYADAADIAVINSNMDIINSAIATDRSSIESEASAREEADERLEGLITGGTVTTDGSNPMTGNLKLDHSAGNVTQSDNGVTSSSVRNILIRDSGGNNIGWLESYISTSAVETRVGVREYDSSGVSKNFTVKCVSTKAGARSFEIPSGVVLKPQGGIEIVGAVTLGSNVSGQVNGIMVKGGGTRNAWMLKNISASDKNGDAVLLGNGGMTVVGGGNSADSIYTVLTSSTEPDGGNSPGWKRLVLASDYAAHVYVNCATIGNRVHWLFDGNLLRRKVETMDISTSNNSISSNMAASTSLSDKNGRSAGFTEYYAGSDGRCVTTISARKLNGSTTVENRLALRVLGDYSKSVDISEPAAWRDALGASSGIWPATLGGTGQNTLNKSANALINALGTGDSTPTDADYYVSQFVGGGTTTTTYHRRPMSMLWNYVKGKGDSSYASVVRGEALPASADLNSYRTPGTYYANSSSASGFSHCPVSIAFKMLVEQVISSYYLVQRLVTYTNEKWSRYIYSGNSGSTWTYGTWLRDAPGSSTQATANRFLATPNGSAGLPEYRSIVNADLPTVSVSHGGTGATTASPNRVFAGPSSGSSASAPSFRALVDADMPSSISISKLSGTLPVNKGGTGATTKEAARTNLGLGTAATHPESDFQAAGSYASATHYHAYLYNPASSSNLHRLTLTSLNNIRVDERSSTSGTYSTFAFAALISSSQPPSDSTYQEANRVLATPNGSNGLPIMRKLAANDLPDTYFSATKSRTAKTVLAAPSGSSGAASFRSLVAADIPNLPATKITSGALAPNRLQTKGWTFSYGSSLSGAHCRYCKIGPMVYIELASNGEVTMEAEDTHRWTNAALGAGYRPDTEIDACLWNTGGADTGVYELGVMWVDTNGHVWTRCRSETSNIWGTICYPVWD